MKQHRERALELPGFRLLWLATLFSQFGIAISTGALAMVVVIELELPDAHVPLLLAFAGLAAAVFALPLGPFTEKRRKRPLLVRADLFRAVLLISIPLLTWTGLLSFAYLATAMALLTLASIVSGAANGAHLRDLLPSRHWGEGNGRLESITWIMTAVFTPVGGLLVTVYSPGAVLVINAAMYLISALIIRRIRDPEPAPEPSPPGTEGRIAAILKGWAYIHRKPQLRSLFWNAMLFGGCITLTAPLLAVFMLRELHLDPWAYTLVLGLPAAAGFLGASLSSRITRRFGDGTTLLAAGSLRSVWLVLLPLSQPGYLGLLWILACQSALMFAAGVFNPVFATYRMRLVDRGCLSRVGASWPITAKLVQPLGLGAGSLTVGLFGVRATLVLAGIVMLACIPLLPWRTVSRRVSPAPPLVAEPR